MTLHKALLFLSAAASFSMASAEADTAPTASTSEHASDAAKTSDNKSTDNKSAEHSKTPGTEGDIVMPKELEPVAVKASEDEMKKFESMLENVMKSEKGLEIMQKLQIRAQFTEIKDEQQTRKLLDTHKSALTNEESAIVLGNPKGTVNLVLVADPLCQNCRMLMSILSKIAKQQPSLKVILHQWAFVNPEESGRVSRYLQAAYNTDSKAYNKLHEAFLALKDIPNDDMMKTLINGAKYDFAKVETLAKATEAQKQIDDTRNLAKELKFPGAPILMAQSPEGQLMLIPPVSMEELNKIVSELAKATAGTSTSKEASKSVKVAAAA